MTRLKISMLLVVLLCSIPAAAQLQYFGYVNGADEDTWIKQTNSYTNWSWLIYTPERSTPWMTQRLDKLGQSNMKAILELGQLFWNPAGGYTFLHSDYVQRWNTFKTALHPYLSSGQVIAIQIRDEPFLARADMYGWQAVAQMIKSDYPNIKILLVESVHEVACPGPSCYFNIYKNVVQTVDWLCVVSYGIQPSTDLLYREGVDKMKATYPGRKMVYAADGFWGDIQKNAWGLNSLPYMREIMTQWYDVARADPDAVLLGVFIFGPTAEGLSSKDFPCDVIAEHIRVGRAITGRTRAQTGSPVGVLEGIDAYGRLTGWAYDPDGALCETPQLDVKLDGGNHITAFYPLNDRFALATAPAGVAYRFFANLTDGTRGHLMTAFARDLDGGGTGVTLPSNCPQNPACVW